MKKNGACKDALVDFLLAYLAVLPPIVEKMRSLIAL